MKQITAHGKLGDQEIEAPVINPSDWFGMTWLIAVSMGYEASYFVVEAGCMSDACDEFADSEKYGHLIRIEEHEYGDYAFAVGKGDMVMGQEFEEAGWVDLSGKFYKEDPKLSEPHVSGTGTYYDTDNLFLHGMEGIQTGKGMPWPCTYHWDGMPEELVGEGVTALELQDDYDRYEESLES